MSSRKPRIWYVDDLSSNLEKFSAAHRDEFEIETFSNPAQVIEKLKTSKPDALLCDIFFYETEAEAREMEEKVQKKAEELREFGRNIGADQERNRAGINLIESISSKFGGKPPFPMYAYTSKGPYLLEGAAFDNIARAGVRWLFKARYSPPIEHLIISQDVEEFKQANSVSRKMFRGFWFFLIGSGILGGVVASLIVEALKHWLRF